MKKTAKTAKEQRTAPPTFRTRAGLTETHIIGAIRGWLAAREANEQELCERALHKHSEHVGAVRVCRALTAFVDKLEERT